MKIVYPICCGLDVHKKTIVATIVKTDNAGVSTYQQRTFTTINSDIINLKTWLLENNCRDVCMESTGKYWVPVFNYLESDINVCLTHPKYVKAIKGKKTDKKDSKWIADVFKMDMLKSSFIPPKEIRELREVSRYRHKLVCMKLSEKNRVQNCMTVSNIGIASVVSDPFGKTAKDIISYLLEHTDGNFDEQACRELIQKRAKAKSDEIIESIRGYKIEEDQSLKMGLAREHMEYLAELIAKTEKDLFIRILPHMEMVNIISDMPGMNALSATLVIAEIGVNMDIFESSKHFASWAGLSPANNESAGKKKSNRVSKAGQYLKPLLVQCALAAIRSKKNPYFAIKYQRIKKRRGHKKAVIAIARMMLA